MKFFLGLGMFFGGIAGFAMASTAGEPEVFMWMLSAMVFLAGAAVIALDYAKDETN